MNELEKLYNVLIEKGLYTKSFQEFEQRYSKDEQYKNKVYDVVSSRGLYTKDKNSFFQKYSGVAQSLEDLKVDYKEPKKKVATASSGTVGSSASARIPRFKPEGIEEDFSVKSDATAVRSPRIVQAQEIGKPLVDKPIDEKQDVAISMEGMPKMSEFEYEVGKPLPEQIQSVSPDQRKIELETNPFISFGKKLWETISLQTPSALQAKGAQGISNLVESDIRLLKSVADVPDDEIIEMPSLADPRAGRTAKYKASEYKKLITEKIAKGNKATGAALELAIKLNKDLENSDVISSLTQVKDGYDLVNFISSSIGQTLGQVPVSLATGGSLSYAMESGNIYLETIKEIAEKEGITPLQVIQQGKDQVALAEIGGAISGALELFGAKKILDAFGVENIKKDLRKKALTFLINTQVEGATETGQEGISKAAIGLGAEGQLRGVSLTEALDAYAAGMFGAAGVQLPSLLAGSKKKTQTKEEEKGKLTPSETVELDTKIKVEPTEEILQPVILEYGDSKFGFIRDESGKMELTKDLDNEDQAISMSEMLSKTYKKLDFTIQEIDSTDPYTPTKYKVIATEKAPATTEVSYKIDGSKMDRARFVAAVGEAKNEEALNELETTDPEVQKVIDAKRAELTGEIQPEVEVSAVETPETEVEAIEEIQPVTINVADKYTADEVERVKTLPIENEDGATMNLDGTKYEKGGVVIPLSSRNLPLSELTQERINEFVKENSESIGSDLVKVGIYKFPGRAEASIDINIVADRSRREEAIQIARELGQESIFDLDTFENIKTGADGKNPKVLTPKEFLEIQERLSRTPEATVTPETSSNYANMTEDNEGNFVFFHVGDKGYETIKPGTGMAPVTSREEAAALSKVGGLAMYYTGPEQGERQTAQGAKYAVKVPKNKVYDFNTDPLNLIEEAKKRHEEENPGKAFDPNSQIAYVTKIAGERGFDMVVADWAGGTRAQTTKELAPVDVEESTGNVVEKKFSEEFKSNKEKGFKSVVPARKADKLQKVYEKINEERNSQKRYDDLYRLYTETNKYTQDEITDLINNSDLSQEIKDEYNAALESKEEKRRSEVPGKKAKARLSSGVEQQDTRTQEEEIVREMDKLAEESPEESAFEEVQDVGKKDIGEAVAQNPTPNKKSFVKKALEFLGLSSENQLYRNIEEFANMPMMIGISDTLGSGVFKDALGNPMNVDGGLLFNLFRNPTLAWANVDKKYAENLVKQAKQVYTSNKELYDRLWKEGALPEGHIPYAIVRMGDDALYSNEAIFRYLSPWIKTLPLENRQAALEVLKKDLGVSAKNQAGIKWILELQDNIENGSIENFDGLLSYVNNLKNSGLPDTITKSVVSLEKSLKNLKGDEAFSDGIDMIAEMLDKKAPIVVLNFIEKNNITTVDQLFDAIAEDAVKRAKGDPNNKSDLSLPIRAFISTKIFSTDPLTTGKPSSNFSKALLGKNKNPLWADVDKLTLPYIKDQISEPAMLAARPGDIVAVMGIDVRDGSSGVAQANHNNYGYGPKGKLIAYLKEPARAFDVFAELKAKAPRLFKPNKSGVYPSPESVVRQAGGVAYVDVPFRGARLLTEGVTKLDLIIGNLRTAFPEVGVFTTEQEFDEFLKQEGIRSRKDQNGNTIYGITKDGKVFLNPENKSLRTPIHEFGHIWVDYLRSKASGKRGKELLDKGLKLVDGTQEYTEALEKYGERDLALEEALVELIATKGDTIINASQKSKFKNWLNALFKYIKDKFVSTKDLFDTKKTQEVEFKKFIENMTIDDFMNVSLADLFGMSVVSKKFKASEASTSAKARMSLGKLPARVNEQINNIISEQKALGNKPVDVAREATKYLKSTEAYNKLGDRDKAKVLSGVKRLSGMRVKVTVDEYASLKDQIRLEAKAAKDAVTDYKTSLRNLVASVRALVKAGKISTFRAGVIIGRISKTNLTSPESVNKTISYVADIFDNANLAMKVSRAKSLIKNAKRNIKSKIGQNPDLFTAAKVLVSIDPHFIPTPMIDDYLEIMEVIGERARVLSIQDAGDLTAKMNVIINAVMNESESVVNSAEQEKITMTPEESVEAAQSLIDQIKSDKLDTSNIVDPNDAAVARNIASITENDMNDLLSVDKDGITDFSKLKLLLGIRENIKAGIVTHEAMVLSTSVNQNRNKNQLQGVVNNLTGAKILNGVTRTISKIKGAITERGGVLEAIRSTPLEFIDDVIGNFNDKTIHKLTFGILGSAKGKLDARLADLAAKAAAAEKLLQSAGRTDNAVVEAKYKIMVLQLQREFESNPGSPSVAPAIEFIDATLRAITRKESSLTNNDARILQEVRSQLTANGIAGIENSLTENDKKAMALIDEINAAQASEALFTSAVIRGNRVNIINNYVHHAVLSKNQRQETEAIINRLFDKGATGKPSTKAGTLNERTPGAKAIMFDPVSASMRGARETLTDFYMTPAIREVTGTLNKLKDSVFDDPNSTQEQRDVAQALVESVQESLEVTFQNHFGSDSAIEAFLKAIQKLGYQTTLASIPRAFAELSSNMSFAILSDPKTTTDALKYTKFAFSTDLLSFLEKIGSAESTRLAGNQTLTGKYAEGGFAAGYGRTSKSAASSKVMDYASFITRMTIGKAYRVADVTSDLLISTPDKVVSRAFYVADFINNFEKETGIRLTNNDLNKIADGTSEYLSPEFESAIQKARQTADSDIVRMAASGNSFNTILKNAPRKTDNAAMSAYRAINSFMSRFYLTEYGTLRSAVIALFKSGEIDKKAASAIIAASVTRMSMYLVAYSLLSSLFDSMIAQGLDIEEEEEDDEDLITKMKRSIVGTGVGVLSRRTLGNLGYMPIAFAVEQLNEDLGEDFGLRDDDYDPYKNSLVYSKISENDLLTKNPIEVIVKAVAGPLSPALSSAARAVTLYGRATKEGSKKETKERALEELETRMVLEAAGNLGLIPFYKDARRILLNDFYARNYDKKDDSSFTITQKQIDLVRKSNPTLARELQRIYNTQKAEEKKLEDFKKKFEKRQTKSN